MFNYKEMDTTVSLDRCLEVIETDKKGERTFHREKNKKVVCTVGDREITVKYNLALPMQALWENYTDIFETKKKKNTKMDYYDPCDVLSKVQGSLGFIAEAGLEYNLVDHFPRDAVQLTKEQAQKRYLWFARACGLCGSDECLRLIAERFPKKKDGCLHRRRVLRIATLFYCDRYGTLKQLVARDTSERELVVSIRDAHLLRDELRTVLADVASTTDLFDFQ